MKIYKLFIYSILSILIFSSCEKEEESSMKNDFLKKTVSPAIVGEKIEFAYAMGCLDGTLGYATSTASIAGGEGTGFELYSYYTTRSTVDVGGVRYTAGSDVPLRTVKETSTTGAVSKAVMESKIDEVYVHPYVAVGTNQVDMTAATIRYNYLVPESARGKEVSFTFESESSKGAKTSITTPAYKISKMDMRRLIDMSNSGAKYFSIAEMKAYTLEEVQSSNLSGKIDFVYIYQAQLNGFTYGHAFVSPASDSKYFAIDAVPAGWTKNSTKMEKRVDVRDAQLKRSVPNVYIDDIDFETLEIDHAYDFVLNFVNDEGAFMKTADGKYLAYIYVNTSSTSGTIRVSIKRYPL